MPYPSGLPVSPSALRGQKLRARVIRSSCVRDQSSVWVRGIGQLGNNKGGKEDPLGATVQNFTLHVKRLCPLSNNLHFASTGQTLASTFEGVTDQLLKEASALFESTDEAAIAAHVCEGERRTAAALVAALNESGVPASVLMPEYIQLIAEGTYLETVPFSV